MKSFWGFYLAFPTPTALTQLAKPPTWRFCQRLFFQSNYTVWNYYQAVKQSLNSSALAAARLAYYTSIDSANEKTVSPNGHRQLITYIGSKTRSSWCRHSHVPSPTGWHGLGGARWQMTWTVGHCCGGANSKLQPHPLCRTYTEGDCVRDGGKPYASPEPGRQMRNCLMAASH